MNGRADRYRDLLASLPDANDNGAEIDEGDDLKRYALVERSSRDASHWVSTFETKAEASTYHGSQEYPEDWPAVQLVDLDTGERFYCIPRLFFESLPDQWEDGQLTNPGGAS